MKTKRACIAVVSSRGLDVWMGMTGTDANGSFRSWAQVSHGGGSVGAIENFTTGASARAAIDVLCGDATRSFYTCD
jgi:hypothetical protein